jgi:hypothetical protein
VSGPSKKLYVYEQVISRAEYKKLSGRLVVTDKQWQKFCESMSDALDSAAGDVVAAHKKSADS